MAIKLKDGSIFLHIPKTGGSWISEVLKKLDLIDEYIVDKHANWDRVLYQEYFGSGKKTIKYVINKKAQNILGNKPKPDRPFVFCFVRNPIKWYESWWRYMESKEWVFWGDVYDKENWHPNAILNGLGEKDFNAFVKNVIRTRPGYVNELYSSYTQPGISYIGRTENLKDDLIQVLNLLNFKFDEDQVKEMAKVNASPKGKEEIIWEPKLIEIVKKLESSALLHYGYLKEKDKETYKEFDLLKENSKLSTIPLK